MNKDLVIVVQWCPGCGVHTAHRDYGKRRVRCRRCWQYADDLTVRGRRKKERR